VRTFNFTKKPLVHYDDFILAYESDNDTVNFCTQLVDNMTYVSNHDICHGATRDVGYFYTVSFPVGQCG
jgi:hypothetical protein